MRFEMNVTAVYSTWRFYESYITAFEILTGSMDHGISAA
jgi:hypothetical protein